MNIFTSRLRRAFALPYYNFPSAGLFIGLFVCIGIVWLPLLLLNIPFYQRLEQYPNSFFLLIGGFFTVVLVCSLALTNPRTGLYAFIIVFPILNKSRLVLSFVTPEVLITPVSVTILVVFMAAFARQNANPLLKWQNPMKMYDRLIFLLPLMTLPSIFVAEYKWMALKAYQQSFIEPVLIYYVVRVLTTSPKDVFLLVRAFAVSVFVSVAYILIELFAYFGMSYALSNFATYGLRLFGERSAATGGYSEIVATAIIFVTLLPLLFPAAFFYKSIIFEYAALACILISVWSLSRGPSAALFFILPYLFFINRKKFFGKSGIKLLLIMLLVISTGSSYLITRWERALGWKYVKADKQILGYPVGEPAWIYYQRNVIALQDSLQHPLGIGGFHPTFYGAGIFSISAEYGIFTFFALFLSIILMLIKLIRHVHNRLKVSIPLSLFSFFLCMGLGAGTLTPKFYTGDPQKAYLIRWETMRKLSLPYNDKVIWLFILLATGAALIYTYSGYTDETESYPVS